MHLGHDNPGHTYTMNGQQLGKTDEERDIGVAVTRSLKPTAQCMKAVRTASMVLGQISRAFHFRDRYVFVRLYIQYRTVRETPPRIRSHSLVPIVSARQGVFRTSSKESNQNSQWTEGDHQ